MIRIFTFVFLFVLVYIYITSKLYLYNMIVSLHEYALIFIIFDITLCFHIVLSISRRNREQLFEGFFCFPFIIPINIVNIIYFFLIKPNEILSVFVNYSICLIIVGSIIPYTIYNMWSIERGRYIFIGYRDIIFGIISAIVGIFYYDMVIKRVNSEKLNKVNEYVNGDIVAKIRTILENDDIFVLSLEKYIFICVVVFLLYLFMKKYSFIYMVNYMRFTEMN